ncbi:MAG TPA: hypothetical protein DD379_23515 [Cyanobacteria bacterium UBA11162]|nr:hypothetical protein [Cyanobacteria bacterium UBA11370]HBL14300.1 hypothetical protein [Cyanobacteria bacterium UBA11162]HBY81573.1 hypothetical protein [Cyanobacteria bacterium UBA11148]
MVLTTARLLGLLQEIYSPPPTDLLSLNAKGQRHRKKKYPLMAKNPQILDFCPFITDKDRGKATI